jgi:glucose/arabinose dehydrogenase
LFEGSKLPFRTPLLFPTGLGRDYALSAMRRLHDTAAAVLTFLTVLGGASRAPAVPLATVRVASALSRPTFVTHAPGDFDRLFIVEQTGAIKILNLQTGMVLATPFINLSALLGTHPEAGLYTVAFHPNYATNGFFFVTYTAVSGNSVLARYHVLGDPVTSNVADPLSGTILLDLPEPHPSHNIGWLAFGPNDGYLYFSIGDGGDPCDPLQRAQNLNMLFGKVMRIDVDSGTPYGIPPDNPFVGVAGADEIWAYGFRNPWRNAFDSLTGALYIADVGHLNREEINYQPASSSGGENYGWDCMEGTACSTVSSCRVSGCTCGAPGLVAPIHEYDHGSGCSITGGEVYRGCAIPDLDGTYFFGDFCSPRIWSFRYNGTTMTDFQERTAELAPGGGLDIASIVSFGRDAFGELYIMDLFGGEVFKIVPGISGVTPDCNQNGLRDACDILAGTSADTNGDGIPDECHDHFMFYRVTGTTCGPDHQKFGPVQLADQLDSANYAILAPKGLGLPANKNLEGVTDDVTHLTEYKVKRMPGEPGFQPLVDVQVVNQCNDLLVEVKKPVSVLVPTNKSLIGPVPPPVEMDHEVDHFLCYKAKAQRVRSDGLVLPKFPRGIQVDVADQFESRRYDLKKVTKLCVPVAKSGSPSIMCGPTTGTPKPIDGATIRNPANHLLCYKAKPSSRSITQAGCGPAFPNDSGVPIPLQPPHTPRLGVHLNNQFGPLQLDTIREREFCVPSTIQP